MDGEIYAAISHNLSQGKGDWLHLELSNTYFSAFYEHPPLFFAFQSFFFALFGSGMWVERLFCLLTLGANLFLIRGILIQLNLKRAILPAILLFVFTPTVVWSFQNNMLETLMSAFCLAAVYCGICVFNESIKKVYGILLMTIFILLAFGSKGFPGLFPLALFPILYISFKHYTLKKAVLDSTLLIACLCVFIFFLSFYQPLTEYLAHYMDIQVLSALKGELDHVSSRWIIVWEFIQKVLIEMILMVIGFFFMKKKNNVLNAKHKSKLLFFLLIGFSASLPLLVSVKFRGFYLLPSLPFFAMATFIVLTHFKWIDQLNQTIAKINPIYLRAIAAIFIALSIFSTRIYKRDRNAIEVVHHIASNSDTELISANSALAQDYSLIAYFSRIGGISLQFENTPTYFLYITKNKNEAPKGYQLRTEMNDFYIFNESEH